MALIDLHQVVKRYGSLVALDHFDLSIREGEIFGLLGPNGSGKTTSINCTLGLLSFDSGTITVFDKPVSLSNASVKRRIGVVPQELAYFDELTVIENIDYFCSLYIASRSERRPLVDRAIDLCGLGDVTGFRPKKLSGGLKRRLNIACGIAHRPELIFFDEPTVAVDPQSRNAILEGIQQLNADGSTIVYTSHYMEEVEQLATRIMIMDHGQALATGTATELKAQVGTGERLTIEIAGADPATALNVVRNLPSTDTATADRTALHIVCHPGEHNLTTTVSALAQAGFTLGTVLAEPPTLNDVFLTITGKELRD
jgi:ABC-2 type transport system ATP-binding protein